MRRTWIKDGGRPTLMLTRVIMEDVESFEHLESRVSRSGSRRDKPRHSVGEAGRFWQGRWVYGSVGRRLWRQRGVWLCRVCYAESRGMRTAERKSDVCVRWPDGAERDMRRSLGEEDWLECCLIKQSRSGWTTCRSLHQTTKPNENNVNNPYWFSLSDEESGLTWNVPVLVLPCHCGYATGTM